MRICHNPSILHGIEHFQTKVLEISSSDLVTCATLHGPSKRWQDEVSVPITTYPYSRSVHVHHLLIPQKEALAAVAACQNVEMGFQTANRCSWARYCISMFTQTTCKSNRWTNGCQNLFWIRMFGSYNSGAGRRTVSWELIWFLHVSTGLWVVSDVGFKRKKISRVRNRFGTSGNAIGIFSICGRVAALEYVISESCAAVCGSF